MQATVQQHVCFEKWQISTSEMEWIEPVDFFGLSSLEIIESFDKYVSFLFSDNRVWLWRA